MGDPYLSEIRIVSFNFAPQGWAMCNGQLMPINQNQALFSLLGTTYGGNGQTTFGLPDLRNRTPIHFGGSFDLGQAGGQDAHTLTISEMPQHVHQVNAKAPADGGANVNNPVGAFFSNTSPNEIYQAGAGNPPLLTMAPGTIANVGGSQPHENRQPYLILTFCICLIGIFPTQN